MMNRRVARLEKSTGDGLPGCPGCGDGWDGPVVVHMTDGNCPPCKGPCMASIPEYCSDCGRSMHFTIEFDKPEGFSEAPSFADLEE